MWAVKSQTKSEIKNKETIVIFKKCPNEETPSCKIAFTELQHVVGCEEVEVDTEC